MPVIMGTQFLRGLEHTTMIQALEGATHSNWAAFAIILLLATLVSYLFIKLSGQLAFGELKDNSIDKGALLNNGLIPLAFAFEVGYQLKPLLERLGHFFPILGRQFEIDLNFLDFAVTAGSSKPWQIFTVLLGMLASLVILKVLIKNHEILDGEKVRGRLLRSLPIYFLAGLYIAMFIMG